MTIIDHRILIPASQDKVWLHISDLTRNPNWQVDCKAVSMLTTMRSGAGTRWRCTSRSGHDYVLEATAWYDRLGYEYRVVDGSPYQSNKGLIRLQEVPEGTIVQWTFNYELAGLLSGLQNALSTRRRVENEIIDSLRGLYRYVSKSADGDVLQAKSLMRDAPDVEARAHYRPRHPAAMDPTAPTQVPMVPINIEPPTEQDDTRPNPVVKAATAEIREPDFLAQMKKTDTGLAAVVPPAAEAVPVDNTPAADQHTAYKPPETPVMAAVTPAEPTRPVEPPVSAPAPSSLPTATSQPAVIPAPVTEPRSSRIETPEPAPVEPAKLIETTKAAEPADHDQPDFTLPKLAAEDISDLDTSRMSVFEIFGLPKPSETQEMRTVTPVPEPFVEDGPTLAITPLPALKTQSTTVAAVITPDSYWRRIGLRLRLRRKGVLLRRP